MGPSAPAETPAGTDVSLSMERANLLAAYLLPALLTSVLLPYLAVWGTGPLLEGVKTVLAPWNFVPGLVVLVVAHEALHGVGFLLFGRAPLGALHFGIDRQTFTPYAGCRVPLSAAAYRGAIALPCLALGVAPGVAGIATGSGWMALTGALMVAVAGGDLLILWVIRRVDGRARVLDHPSRVGCVLVDDPGPGAPDPTFGIRNS